MPELPEVETTRRTLAPITGAQVLRLELGKPLRWPLGCAPEHAAGHTIGELARRGKYLWMPLLAAPMQLGTPQPAGGLLWHLGMSGALTLASAPSGDVHEHVRLFTTRGVLRLIDPRRFGAVVWAPALNAQPASTLFARLGPEPLDDGWHASAFHAALQTRRTAIKPALLAGELVVGVGNIYASEALFQARIDPRTPCQRIGPARAARLHAAVRSVLQAAVDAGGSTLRNYTSGSGEAGAYQSQAQVYGREGQPCTVCGAAIRRLPQGQRATFHCPRCQR